MKNAKIGRYGGRICEYALEDDDATYADLLAVAGETLKKGETLTVSGETVRAKDVFNDEDQVIIEASTTGA